uniref:family 16 glycosylhydrolase n=1 Tax=Cardiobacterium hominis TaxID=2718 RepID=UPI0028E9B6A7
NVQYQWLRDGQPISGQTGSSYTLTKDDAGHKITVRATYKDNAGHDENPLSEATATVADNPPPQPNNEGTVSITGEGKVGSELTATITDADGVPDTGVTYQWQRDGQPIAQANGKTYTLTPDDAGHKISVQATYKDNAGHDESPTSEATASVADNANAPLLHDDFSSYPLHKTYVDNDTFGAWKVAFAGYGNAEIIDNGGGNQALQLKPMARSGQTETSSTMVVSTVQTGDEFTYSGTIATPEQLRQGATPNAWETAWLVWNHTDNDHYYYFVARADGWELGKRDPAYSGGQRFMATGSESWPLADAKDFVITKSGNTVEISINGKVITTFTDDENPYTGGSVGLYTEDARIVADDINLTATAKITGTANHGGVASINGKAATGEVLHAAISDGDGAVSNVSYQWMAAGKEISGATGETYTVTADNSGKIISVRITYTDSTGKVESVISPPTAVVDSGNDSGANQRGQVTLSGTAAVGETLTANVSDGDGLPDRIQYTWLANGAAINGANGSSYTITAADVGKVISVQVYYYDKAGHEENLLSDATNAVTDTAPPPAENHAPTGSVTITGEAVVGKTLNASNDLADEDGLGNITYHWLADGKEIGTGASYTLTEAEKGKTISVRAEYTDGKGTAEAVESRATNAVAEDTPPPANHEGTVTISGEAKVGSELTATVTDADKFDAANVQYQWLRDGQPIDKANGSTYTLSKDDAGHKITVQATYKDNAGHDESPISEAADIPALSANHQGTVTITGEALVDKTLTATIDDKDGLDPAQAHYQWLVDGKAVDGATNATYKVRPEDAGKAISVHVEYTDNAAHDEKLDSSAADATVDHHSGYKLVWKDEFDGTTLNRDNWGYQTGGWNSSKVQNYYSDSDKNVSVSDGSLKITAHHESTPIKTGSGENEKSYDFSSGFVQTQGKQAWTYGYFEARLKMPNAENGSLWPAFWMSPDKAKYGGWPRSGEIDVLETRSYINNEDRDHDGQIKVAADAHWGTGYGKGNHRHQQGITYVDGSDEWHTYAVKWQEGKLEYYVDGRHYHTIDNFAAPNATEHPGPFNIPFYLRLNVAVGGDYMTGKYQDAHNSIDKFPATMEVDYVRVYQLDGTPPTPPQTNHAPTGSVTISGKAQVGETLSAANTLADEDGLGNITYHWLADGKEIGTGDTYTLTDAEKGKTLSVKASYTDGKGTPEELESDATAAIAEAPAPQTPPTVTISGAENINEGEAALYTVTLDKASDKPVTLTLTLSHGETTDGDLGNISKTLTIPAGETSAKVSLQTTADGIPENTEHYTLSINGAEGATVGADKAVTTAIADNDEKAAYHTGSVADTTFAGDRSANNHYFINSLDSTQRATYGYYSGHKAGEGLRITYAFSEDGVENGKVVDGHRPFSAQQKADIRTVLDHLEEQVNVKFTEGSNATLNFYLQNVDGGFSGVTTYGGNVHLSGQHYATDDAFAREPRYVINPQTHTIGIKHGWQTALHEIGHSLGMDHPFDHQNSSLNINKAEDRNDLTVMSYTTGQYEKEVNGPDGYTYRNIPLWQNKLGIYDLAALHHAYGVNPNYHSGDDTYGFKPFNKDAVGNDIYIHDGSGQDTFDASEQTLDLNIDLTPGSWIYAGSKAEHLALDDSGNPTTEQAFIGYGTQIESAKGGTGNDTIKGNSAANYLFGFDGDDNIDGGAGSDQIEGGRGNDTLKGGAGGDTFIFRSPFDGTIDTLLDFNAAEGDRIQLDHNIFTGLQKGGLSAEQFVKGTEAKDADDRIIYNQATGELAYDADGNGSDAAVTIARLGINTELEQNHIQII